MRKNRKNLLVCVLSVVITIFSIKLKSDLLWLKNVSNIENNQSLKYVLLWNNMATLFSIRRNGELYQKHCSFNNCYITWNKTFFSNISGFDAIIFHGPELWFANSRQMPKERFPHQSYIFASKEAAQRYPLKAQFKGVFNFSWTYKLNSDINFSYFVIRDLRGKIIGPNVNVPWIQLDNMLPINDTIKQKLASKSIAAAWFVSNCVTKSHREILATKLIKKLREYNMTVHVYGRCGSKRCPRFSSQNCLKKLQRDYYFYFAFENSLSQDYVTEKLLNALQNYAIPIVFGGADYTRFMPYDIYLNVKEMSHITLVKHMSRIIKEKDRYYEFFKWHNHYTYHKSEHSPDSDPLCSLCRFINNIHYNNKKTRLKNVYKWWNYNTE